MGIEWTVGEAAFCESSFRRALAWRNHPIVACDQLKAIGPAESQEALHLIIVLN